MNQNSEMYNQCRHPLHQESAIVAICCAKKCSQRLNCLQCLNENRNLCQKSHPQNLIELKKLKSMFEGAQNSQLPQFKKILQNIENKAHSLFKQIQSLQGSITNLETQLDKFVNGQDDLIMPNTELTDLVQDLVRIIDLNQNGFSFDINQDSIINFLNSSDDILKSLSMMAGKPTPVDKLVIEVPDLAYKTKIRLILHQDAINCVAISPDSCLLATSSYDQTIKLTNLKKDEYSNLKSFNLQKMEDKQSKKVPQIFCLAFSENSKLLASGGEKILLLWDLSQPEPVKINEFNNSNCSNVVFSHEYLISGGSDIKVWNITKRQIHQTFQVFQVTGIVAYNQYIISIQLNGFIEILDLELKKLILKWKAHSKGLGLSISPDQNSLISSSIKGEIVFWDLPTILGNLKTVPTSKYQIQDDDDNNKINLARLSNDNKILIACGSDNKSKVWDVKSKQYFQIEHEVNNNPEQYKYNGDISNDMKYIIFGNLKYVNILVPM